MKGIYERVNHSFDPLCDRNSEILILGSMPSKKSREISFYYGHPQNRFWKVLEGIFNEQISAEIEEKKRFCLSHKIALFDVIESCEIIGSSDASIRNVSVNNIEKIIQNSNIKKIILNGQTAMKLYKKYIKITAKVPSICLSSTSPANAKKSLNNLISEWKPHFLNEDK